MEVKVPDIKVPESMPAWLRKTVNDLIAEQIRSLNEQAKSTEQGKCAGTLPYPVLVCTIEFRGETIPIYATLKRDEDLKVGMPRNRVELGLPLNLDPTYKQPLLDIEKVLQDMTVTVQTQVLSPQSAKVVDLVEVGNRLMDGFQALTRAIGSMDVKIENWQMKWNFHTPVGKKDWLKPAKSGECVDPFYKAFEMLDPFSRRDPLILDLDGDGIGTIGVQSGAYFDHDGDGFAEQTGWVDLEDGLLVMDRNGDGIINDGTELFGDQTILQNGARATNGFQALAELDSNRNGKIDAADAAFSQLRVWSYDDRPLRALDGLGITSIDLNSTPDSTIDSEGNTRTRAGSFQRADGTTGDIGEYNVLQNRALSVAEELQDVPEDTEGLPELRGYGNVYDLHQAIVRDTSGQLKSLVEQFINASDRGAREALMTPFLFDWTHAEGIEPASRGAFIDARKLAVLEHLFGQTFAGTNGPSPTYEASILLNESYRRIYEMTYSHLMAQTHLKNLYDKLSYTWDEEKGQLRTDFSGVIPDLVASLDSNPEQGRQLLSEFARSLRGYSSCPHDCYMIFREHMLEIDPDLGWIIDSGGLPVVDHLGQGMWPTSPHLEGTDNAEAIRGSLTWGDGTINGRYGNDVIYGTARHELLVNESGESLLFGAGGKDWLWGASDGEILDGGEGNDILYGMQGNDTYVLRTYSGQDTIYEWDPTPGNTDTIWLGSNLIPDDITLRRSGNNLVLKIIDTTDALTVSEFFRYESSVYRIEQIQFMDGAIWTTEEIIERAYAPTEHDDVIYGGPENDSLSGLGGGDKLYALDGEDILDGGSGDDVIDGGAGSDSYRFSRGSDQDVIVDQDTTAGAVDTILLDEGILPTDIRLQRVGNDLQLTISGTQDALTVKGCFLSDTGVGVEAIQFADGTVWSKVAIQEIVLQGTEADDLIVGYEKADTIAGLAGDDRILGKEGDDFVEGGPGRDELDGGSGGDLLRGGDGEDRILGGAGADTLGGAFWYFYKGMWLKGLPYFGIALVCGLIFPAVGALPVWVAASFNANWDYYLFKVHGETFFTSHWLSNTFPLDLQRRFLINE